MKSQFVKSRYEANEAVQFNVLSDNQCEEIFHSAMEVLRRTGSKVYDPDSRDLLKKGGAFVDGEVVKFPSALIEWAVRTAPSRVVLCDRNGKAKLFLEGKNVYFGPGPSNNFVLDPFTGERREPTTEDTVRAAICCDYLPNIDYAMDMGTVRNVNLTLSDVYSFEALLTNTTKPIVHWGFDIPQYQDILEMCIAVAGSLEELQKNPFIAMYSEPLPPLRHSREAIAKAVFVAEKGLPLIYTPCTMAGATTPATMAGTIVLQVAESLVGLVAAQLKREGTPFIMGGLISIMDMSSTILSYGAPELALLSAGMSNVAQYMKIPVFSTGGCTDAKTLDAQAAIQGAMSILMAAQSGASLVHDCGYIEYGSTSSTEMLVMDDEIIGMVKRIMRGVEVNDETLAVDVIDSVGPGGHFLRTQHTRNYFKKETWYPSLIDRKVYEGWRAEGSKTMGTRIKEKTQMIINEHNPEKLPEATLNSIKAIIQRAEQREAAKV
ncbi:MAG: trimethylamine methyltransferase family protein [Eubacteriales bacterium]